MAPRRVDVREYRPWMTVKVRGPLLQEIDEFLDHTRRYETATDFFQAAARMLLDQEQERAYRRHVLDQDREPSPQRSDSSGS